MYLSKATFPFTCLLSPFLVVFSTYDDYASTSPTTSGPIEWMLGGVQGIFNNHFEYDSACDECDGKLTQLVLIEQGQGRCMRREETISGRPVLLVSVWPVPDPVLALLSPSQVSAILSQHARLRRAIHRWCSTCMAPDLLADHFKGVGRLPMWTSGKRECAIEQCCGQTVNWESRSWTSSVHSQRSTVAHKLFFKTSACGLLARRGSNQRLWTGSLRRATPSLRAARGHLTHVRGATWQTCDSSESEKARDLVLVPPRVRNRDCSCRRVNESHSLREGKRRATEAQVT